MSWHWCSMDSWICLEHISLLAARSSRCGNGMVCNPCQTVPTSDKFRKFVERALEVPQYTPWEYLNARQLQALMAKMAAKCKRLRTQLENAKKSNSVSSCKINDYRRIMMLLASNDVAGLRRTLAVALKRGASPHTVYALLEHCLLGRYSPRGGFSDRDHDISFLVKAIGGPKLLYALQKSHGLASLSTVRRHQAIPRLLPSIGIPTLEEINSNISALLDPSIKPPPEHVGDSIPGNILMVDGVALETKCRYCPHRDAIVGLCREHSHLVDTTVSSLESVEAVRTALFNPPSDKEKVCFGSDGTVVGVAPYARETNYSTTPIVLSPSDKTEKGPALAAWMQTVLDAWKSNPNGEKLHGPIWALGSDGDSAFRLAKHILCMVEKVDPNSELGKQLHSLRGLNLYTSKKGVVGTCDPKHVIKRFATLERNSAGIMIIDTLIKPQNIIRHLCFLPNMSKEAAELLLDPTDKQNVPKAISLIQHLSMLKDLPPPPNPTDAHYRKTIVFFSEVLGYFVFPFIDVGMDLSEQVRSLSTYAHLLTALQIKHGSACFTGALYADSQSIVKNIIFVIARLKAINPDLKFYIIHEGTDRLELVFSDCRTLDHASNFDAEQLAEKLSLAALINAAFERNPDLDRGHRRLSLKGALGIDRVNPRSWEGNTRVGDVDLDLQWEGGCIAANEVLKRFFGDSAVVDFVKLFSDPECDTLRPVAHHYVGVRPSADDRRSEGENASFSIPDTVPASETGPPTAPEILPVTSWGEDSESEHGPDLSPTVSAAEISSILDETDFRDEPLGLNIDDFIPETVDDIEQDTPPVALSRFLMVEGKKYLKSSIISSLSSNRSKKATMRTLRVCGVALEDLRHSKSADFDSSDLNDEDLMKEGDLVATLLHSGSDFGLGVMIVKGFRVGQDHFTRSTFEAEQVETNTKVRVIGQLMELRNIRGNRTTLNFWEWTGKFLRLDVTATDERATRQQFVLEVPGILVRPLGPSVAPTLGAADGNPNPLAPATWRIPAEQLNEILLDAWLSLEPEGPGIEGNIQMLPQVVNPDALPYRDAAGLKSLLVMNIPEHLVPKPKLTAKSVVSCFICGQDKTINKMRDHIGCHILRSLRRVEEPQQPLHEVGADPCGFCGRDGCHTQLINKRGGSTTIHSSCPYHYARMNYKSATQSSKSSPCTNVPIHCPICPPAVSGDPRTIWKYNAAYHMLSEHNDTDLMATAPKFVVGMFIRKEEEARMGIDAEHTASWRNDNRIPDSDVIDVILVDSEAVKRARGNTASTVSSDAQPKQKRAKPTRDIA
ncbi:hypothetical protein B0H10DRAFT_2198716 [Mycena sp. CBHHK59/15]|nr:hypothetical protein B0H10DRAFT_2198716 [Mycena sp. CBHHK59/15]